MSSDVRYLLRPTHPAESDLIYHWRNEPRVRAVMPFAAEIDPAYHRQWWPKALTDPARRMFILEDHGAPVATLVFLDVKPGISAAWGFYTAPHDDISRSKAIEAWLLCDYAGLHYPFAVLGVETLHCEVLESNRLLPIRRRMGFTPTGARFIDAERPPFIQLQMTRAQYQAAARRDRYNLSAKLAIRPDPRDAGIC